MALPPEVLEILDRVRRNYPATEEPAEPPTPETPAGMVRLTPQMIHAGRSGPGRWNKRQLAAIGIAWGELRRSGWIGRAAGRPVSRDAYALFLSLRGARKGANPILPEER